MERDDDVVMGAAQPVRKTLTLAWRGKTPPVMEYVEVQLHDADAASIEKVRYEIQVDPWTPPDPLDVCLQLWRAWMHGDADRDLGAKPMGGLMGDTDGHGVDVHEQQQAADQRIAIATDAMIESMPRLLIWAIYKLCSIANPWNFPNADIFVVGQEAREVLAEKLKKNVCTSILF